MKNTTIIIQLAIITYFLISISSKVDIGNEAQQQQVAEKAKQAQEDEHFKKEYPTLSALINILTSYHMIIILSLIIFFSFFRMIFKN